MPEKIPVQSLRESIVVLQDQLQNREQTIEKLEAELAAVDKDMPNKLRRARDRSRLAQGTTRCTS